MSEVVRILEDVLSELRSVPVHYEIPDEEFVGPLIGRGLKAKRSRSVPKKRKSFNINVPLWYKDVEENNASKFHFSISTKMEPKAMTSKSNANNDVTENDVKAKDTTTDTGATTKETITERTIETSQKDDIQKVIDAIEAAETRGYQKGVLEAKAAFEATSNKAPTFMEGFKLSSGIMTGITLVSIVGMAISKVIANRLDEKEVEASANAQ
jgi:hypothetical protein